MRRIVLPTARAGLLTAVILGIARIVGETAPLILTALGNTSYNADPFHGKQDALPLFVYRLVRFPQAAAIQRAWTGALVLLDARARAVRRRPHHRRVAAPVTSVVSSGAGSHGRVWHDVPTRCDDLGAARRRSSPATRRHRS